AGCAMAFGGGLRDGISTLAESGALGDGYTGPATGYIGVYLIEIALLFVTLAVVGPLVRRQRQVAARPVTGTGLAGPAPV
ncbi:MAG: PucC family protein, partial [Roseomonas sp.]|nr:PucC family protein [Roseomonas sp.]